jgi:hypothetical protein
LLPRIDQDFHLDTEVAHTTEDIARQLDIVVYPIEDRRSALDDGISV